MAGDAFLIRDGPVSVPLAYVVPQSGELLPLSVRATLNGASSGQPYYAVVQLIAPSGHVLGNYITDPIAAGASADVTWFPGAETDEQGSGQSGGGTGVEAITSQGGTIAVTSPSGPTTNLELPVSGVTPATYGDSAHVAQVQVNADGIVTGASNVAITGVGGGMANVFDQTLAVATPEIDTGAAGVPAGYSGLMVTVIARADPAVFSQGWALRFNNDSGNNYQFTWTDQSGTTITGLFAAAANGAKVMEGPGASISAGIFGMATVMIPGYAATTANKVCSSLGGFASDASHSEMVHSVSVWNNTAAITRIALFTGGGNMIPGSRMTIYGLP